MGVIKPTLEGRTYSIWGMLMNYALLSINQKLNIHYDPGFRIAIINSCWISIESFTKECLYWHIMTNYDNMLLPNEFKYSKGVIEIIKSIFRTKEENEMMQFDQESNLKERFANKAKDSAWYPVLEICNLINMPIEKSISQWDFLQNLYRLRNGLTHGQTIKILQSNSSQIKDEISREYVKSINYLNGKKIIDKNLLIKDQNISDLLNQDVTNFIIDETAKSFDDIANVFKGSYISAQWKRMRQ